MTSTVAMPYLYPLGIFGKAVRWGPARRFPTRVNRAVASDILSFERVQIVNLHNGSRVETYVLEGAAGSGTICMNGAAARWAEVGDKVIIISYSLMEDRKIPKPRPRVAFVDEKNHAQKK